MKKWFIPIMYFVFGMIVYFAEDFVLRVVNEASIILTNFLNTFNIFLFIAMPILVVSIMHRKGKIKISTSVKDAIYTFFILGTFVFISVFWIITISWK